ncbi:MAG: TraR/DksA family transcriptional regulator [Candidatus Omnitrophota bacterium]
MTDKKKNDEKKQFKKEDLTNIRKELVKEKAKILEELISIKGESLSKSFKDASGDLSGYSFHMADMATDLYDREFSLELAEGEREILYTLDAAIRRVDDGSYGKCDLCGDIIPKQRLKAMPQAECCITCQEKRERSSEK